MVMSLTSMAAHSLPDSAHLIASSIFILIIHPADAKIQCIKGLPGVLYSKSITRPRARSTRAEP